MEAWIRYLIVHKLSGWQHLRDLVPDLDDLLDRPTEVLAKHPVHFGSLNLNRLAGVCCGFLVAVFLFYELNLLEPWLFYGAGSIFTGTALVLLWKSYRPGRHELILRAEGVELNFRGTTVWCPWALFNTAGVPFVQLEESLKPVLYLPVLPEAVPAVELRRDERCEAQGLLIQSEQLSFPGANQVLLYSWYEVFPRELGELLLELGRRIAAPVPAASALPEAYPQADPKQLWPVILDDHGWLTVQPARLVFPPVCCSCALETDQWTEYAVGSVYPIVFAFPFCPACLAQYTRQFRVRSWTGAIVSVCLALAVTAVAWSRLDELGRWFLLLFLAAVGGRGGWYVGGRLAERWDLPFRVTYNYFLRKVPTVSFRFRRPDYAQFVVGEIYNVQAQTAPAAGINPALPGGPATPLIPFEELDRFRTGTANPQPPSPSGSEDSPS